MIANAVVHRNYLDKSCIQVCIFHDRIEVLSPGMLYGRLDIETAKLGKSACVTTAARNISNKQKKVSNTKK